MAIRLMFGNVSREIDDDLAEWLAAELRKLSLSLDDYGSLSMRSAAVVIEAALDEGLGVALTRLEAQQVARLLDYDLSARDESAVDELLLPGARAGTPREQ